MHCSEITDRNFLERLQPSCDYGTLKSMVEDVLHVNGVIVGP